jgi:hypothetical protein
MFTILGDMLLAAFKFDYEDRAEFRVRVRSTDLGNNYIENSFVISITDVDETVGISGPDKGRVRVFPNPFSHSATIRFPNPGGEPFRMKLTDLSGKVVRIVDGITTSEYVLKKDNLRKGLYFIEIRGNKIFHGKLLIE